jgi:glycosyltransferase involved in cell wall biosynthesis
MISFCVPCHNRRHDLEVSLPAMITAANASPPVEISIVDYNSQDGVVDWLYEIWANRYLAEGNHLSLHRYYGREHYHLAHGWNIAAKKSKGDYICIMGADAMLAAGYVIALREKIAEGAKWMRCRNYKGIMCIERDEFMAAGGYDERFEFYGAEDRDMEARLKRRGLTPTVLPDHLVRVIRTSNSEKVSNYRLPLTKAEMIERAHVVLDENNAAGVLVANDGVEWGV